MNDISGKPLSMRRLITLIKKPAASGDWSDVATRQGGSPYNTAALQSTSVRTSLLIIIALLCYLQGSFGSRNKIYIHFPTETSVLRRPKFKKWITKVHVCMFVIFVVVMRNKNYRKSFWTCFVENFKKPVFYGGLTPVLDKNKICFQKL